MPVNASQKSESAKLAELERELASLKGKIRYMKVTFTYLSILEEMNDAAFHYCRELLYPEMDFEILKQQDVRRIDLAEAIYRKQKKLRGKNVRNTIDDFVYTANQIKFVLNTFVKCKDSTPEKKYYKKTISQIEHLKGDNSDAIEAYEDIVKSYLCLIRPYSSNFESHGTIRIFKPIISPDDSNLIKQIKCHHFTTQQEKKVGPITRMPRLVESDNEKITAFIVTILLFVRVLQFEGHFVEDEDRGKVDG